ncbi:MAG: sulfotransferase family protein [Bacteroidetes bacterium]|nr:sulfotransferase family protein [Bacteroidota bacterium]
MSLKIIGSGLGRTGTFSLKLALEHIGFGKCFHMIELFQNPEGVKYFRQAERGEQVNWNELFNGYVSAVDYPGARYFENLAEYYPDAKLIHTYRNPDEWYDSAVETIFMAKNLSPGKILKFGLRFPFSKEVRRRFRVFTYNRMLMDREFGKDLTDKKKVIERFKRHTDNVIKKIHPDRLLIFKASEGWDPLCRFLNVPVPDVEFPLSNDRKEFLNRIEVIGSGGSLPERKL